MNRREMITRTVLAMPAIVTLKIGKDAMGNQGSGQGPPQAEVGTRPTRAPDPESHPWWHCLFGWMR